MLWSRWATSYTTTRMDLARAVTTGKRNQGPEWMPSREELEIIIEGTRGKIVRAILSQGNEEVIMLATKLALLRRIFVLVLVVYALGYSQTKPRSKVAH